MFINHYESMMESRVISVDRIVECVPLIGRLGERREPPISLPVHTLEWPDESDDNERSEWQCVGSINSKPTQAGRGLVIFMQMVRPSLGDGEPDGNWSD